jgi:hypothetical protein
MARKRWEGVAPAARSDLMRAVVERRRDKRGRTGAPCKRCGALCATFRAARVHACPSEPAKP